MLYGRARGTIGCSRRHHILQSGVYSIVDFVSSIPKRKAQLRLHDVRRRLAHLEQQLSDLQLARLEAVIEASVCGLSNQEIANVVGVSKQRVGQILKDIPTATT